MSFLRREYALDKTGISPANRIIGEEHRLGPTRGGWRSFAPLFGPFFNNPETWKVYLNGVPLSYGTDFFGITMVADDTMKFGNGFSGEVCEVFLVNKGSEGDILTLDCQLLGGLYQNHAAGLRDLWDAFLNDNRPIAWKDVFNLPPGFTPAYHLHMLDDVVGWQTVLISLERMTNAIVLRNIPAFEKLIDWVLARTPDIASTTEIFNLDPVDKLITLNRLLYAARYNNFNAITFRPETLAVTKHGLMKMTISSTNFPRIHELYWTIEHEDTVPEMFRYNSGMVVVRSNEGSFMISPRTDYKGVDEYNFRVVLRQNDITGPILAESKLLTMRYNKVWDWDYGLLVNGSQYGVGASPSRLTDLSAESLAVVPGNDFWNYVKDSQ